MSSGLGRTFSILQISISVTGQANPHNQLISFVPSHFRSHVPQFNLPEGGGSRCLNFHFLVRRRGIGGRYFPSRFVLIWLLYLFIAHALRVRLNITVDDAMCSSLQQCLEQ